MANKPANAQQLKNPTAVTGIIYEVMFYGRLRVNFVGVQISLHDFRLVDANLA